MIQIITTLKRPRNPEITNDMLRDMIDAGDDSAKDVLDKRMKKYVATANSLSDSRRGHYEYTQSHIVL